MKNKKQPSKKKQKEWKKRWKDSISLLEMQKQLPMPSIKAGLGLIIRLNVLFNKADRAAMAGDMDEWNSALDRIFINMQYSKKKSYHIKNDDMKLYKEFLEKIKAAKRKRQLAIKKKNRKALDEAKQELYDILMIKDIWLRKLVHERGLYIKGK